MIMRISTLILVLLLPVCTHAVVVHDLYQAEVPVPDQSAASQKQGLSSAMLQVLIKVTGDRNIRGRAVADELIKKPENYLQQYKYRKKPVIENNQLTLEEQLYLWASFNESAINRVLNEYAVPVWGKVRPSTLVWLVVDSGESPRIVGLEDVSGYSAMLEKSARERGIVLVHPLLDETDLGYLTTSDIKAGFVDRVITASERYSADSTLAGTVTQTGENSWQAEWSAIIADNVSTWTVTGDSVAAVLEDGVNRLTDNLAERYVHTSTYTEETGIEIVVNDIHGFDQYSRVLKYLRSLNSVTDVQVLSVKPGNVTYSISSSGGDLAIQRAIELGQTLESLSGSGSPYRLLN